eukprot:4849827-Lingulodinium_polyedra.AAC.1
MGDLKRFCAQSQGNSGEELSGGRQAEALLGVGADKYYNPKKPIQEDNMEPLQLDLALRPE